MELARRRRVHDGGASDADAGADDGTDRVARRRAAPKRTAAQHRESSQRQEVSYMKRGYGVLVGLTLLAPSVGWAQGGLEVVCRPPNGDAVGAAQIPGLPPLGSVPGALVGVNGIFADLSACIFQVGKMFEVRAAFFGAAGTGEVTALMNPDPFISFGTTTTNLVAGPVTYSFLFGTPVVPAFYSTATSTGGVTVTNGASGTATVDNSAVYPTYISGYGTLGGVPVLNLGVDLGTDPCTAGPGAPFTVTETCNQGTTGNAFAPVFLDDLEALLT